MIEAVPTECRARPAKFVVDIGFHSIGHVVKSSATLTYHVIDFTARFFNVYAAFAYSK